MHKDDRYYTFLLTKKSRSNIYIRRVEVSKKWLHGSVATAILSAGIITTAITGWVNAENLQLGKLLSKPTENAAITAQASLSQSNQPKDLKSFNYERPSTSNIKSNIGGPSAPFRLTNVSESEENSMEAELRQIEATSSPETLPTMWAHMGKINNEYGFRRNPFGGRTYEFHGGLDIAGEKGDLVVAPANGVISKAGWQGGYGNLIEIDHGNGLVTRYGHLSKITVQVGDAVQRGELMGLVGSTGRSTGPHLHFEVRLNDKPINPRRFLPPEMPL